MPSITVVSGHNQGDYYPLGKGTKVIGRDEGVPIQIVDELVSRKHVQVRLDDKTSKYYALDMKSANGVLVNGRKITSEIELQDGDEIELGNSKLMFSKQDFKDRESAMSHWRARGQRGKSTLIR